MQRNPIPIEDFTVRPHHLWAEQWMLLTAGEFAQGKFNTMTVAWGSFGTMWHKPFAQIVVRPGRYTHAFTEEFDSFTLSAFPEQYRKAITLLGTKSGRDGDKIADAGLTPVASNAVAAPGFDEAELVVECRKLYRQVMDPAGFIDAEIDSNYPEKDYHTIYFGEIVAVEGVERFARQS
jgi:flavin reductase (DIM6/NTAB) family NADH-FMN oxidoreductase RutF